MDFSSSQTIINLCRSFAGESQARTRYKLYGDVARQEGYEYLYRIFNEISGNEYAHAQVFLNHIKTNLNAVLPNMNIDAGYPFEIGTNIENLLFSATGEHNEFTKIYPSFADIAQKEGFTQIANSWKLIAEVEASHNIIFTSLHEKMAAGRLYKSDTAIEWECSFCGHKYTGESPSSVCPLCSKPQGWVKIKTN